MQLAILFNDISPLFGRFHPLFVHLPIGFILIAYVLEIASKSNRYNYLKSSVLFVLWIGFMSSIMACITGYILAQSGGYGKESILWHQWSGIGVTAMLLLTILLYKSRIYLTIFSFSVLAIFTTGHLGGNLTHGETYLSEHLPEELKNVLGVKSTNYVVESVTYEEAKLYKHLVYPIFHDKCISCHNSSKMKGELNMADFSALLKGGENGEVLMKGNSNKSDLIKRIHLPEDDEDTMPPEGKERITDDELNLISLWIDKDMEENTPLDSIEINTDIIEDIKFRLAKNNIVVSPIFKIKVPNASEKSIEKLQSYGFNVTPIQRDSPFLQVAYFDRSTPLSEEGEKAILALADQIVWLDLTGVKNNNNDWTFLKSLPHLTKIYLSNTLVEGLYISNLKENEFLEVVSLFGTEASSKDLEPLLNLEHLKSLYIGNSNTSKQDTITLNAKKKEDLIIHF